MRIRDIIKGLYELTHEEIELEDKLWHDRIVQCWRIDVEAARGSQASGADSGSGAGAGAGADSGSGAEAKRKQKEYQHQYYITHRKQSNKIVDMSERAVKNRATMTKFRNRLCLYEGETVKYGTLLARLHNKLGYSFHDAKIIADDCLIKEE